jgi:hypothetical protein
MIEEWGNGNNGGQKSPYDYQTERTHGFEKARLLGIYMILNLAGWWMEMQSSNPTVYLPVWITTTASF